MTSGDGWLAEERLTHKIIGAFFRVYRHLDTGFLEHVYAAALERELRRRELRVSREHWARIYYDGVELCQQRLDFVVNERVVLELKSTVKLSAGAARQLLSYLRATNLEVGFALTLRRRAQVLPSLRSQLEELAHQHDPKRPKPSE